MAERSARIAAVGVGDISLRLRLGFPWCAALLAAACVLVTLPALIAPARFYLVLGAGCCELDNPHMHWWHPLVTPFLHGVGCGTAPTLLHLVANVALFVLHGAIIERLLGSARFALLTLTGLVVHMLLSYVIASGRTHGASGMTWSYLLFVGFVLAWMYRRERWRWLRDPLSTAVAAAFVLGLAGLTKHWHVWSVLVSVPFLLAWAPSMRGNLERIAAGSAPVLGSVAGRIAGIGCCAALVAFDGVVVVGAVAGWIR